jgi:hypothetical protein
MTQAAVPEAGTTQEAAPAAPAAAPIVQPPPPETPKQPSLPGETPYWNMNEPHRMRFTLFGALASPTSGEGLGGVMGGVIAYDLWDRLGLELLLAQEWDKTKKAGDERQLKILGVKPGVRSRLWGEEIRVYIMAHVGFSQAQWTDPDPAKGGAGISKLGAGCDGGAGVEFRFAKLILLDLFGVYEASFNNVPKNKSGDLGSYQGFLIGLGVGVSSSL